MKKSEYITFRTDLEIKALLEELATKKKWTISFVVEEIVKDWLRDHKDDPSKL